MALPGRFGTSLLTVPQPGGYLHAVPSLWVGGGLRVGVACAGNPAHLNDFRRSMSPHEVAPLRELAGVAFTSLQVGSSSRQLAEVLGVPDHSAALGDMAATARVIAGLDLVIAVDTAVAHLAGALGKAVWVLLPRAPDWRWLAGRENTPWYASARLFRQERAGCWGEVMARVCKALHHWPAEAPGIWLRGQDLNL